MVVSSALKSLGTRRTKGPFRTRSANPNGTITPKPCAGGGPLLPSIITSAEGGGTNLEPRFKLHGFPLCENYGLTKQPKAERFTGIVISVGQPRERGLRRPAA